MLGVDCPGQEKAVHSPEVAHRNVSTVVRLSLLECLLLKIEDDVPIVHTIDRQTLERDVERRDPLLAVENERHGIMLADRWNSEVNELPEELVVIPLGVPKEERLDREFLVDVVEKLSHLCPVPNVIPLELRNRIKNRGGKARPCNISNPPGQCLCPFKQL